MCEEYNPFVSVIIPTYNRADLLVQAIQSVLNQTYGHFELLIIDDNSSDNTSEIINTIKDNRVHYFRLSKNQGAPAARNIGLKKAKGELVAFLDSDDQWLSTKLEKQVELFNKEKNVGLVYTGIKIISNQLERIILPSKRGEMGNKLLIKNYVGTTSSVLIKKDLLDEVGGFDLTFTSCQDWDLFIRISQKMHFNFIEEPLVLYFEHDGERISTNSKSIIKGHLKIHRKYRKLIKNLPRREILKHYMNLGKKIIKAGLLSIDKNMINMSRTLVHNFSKFFSII